MFQAPAHLERAFSCALPLSHPTCPRKETPHEAATGTLPWSGSCLRSHPHRCHARLRHHSFSAEFDGSKPVRLVGKITRVEWTNPHSYFYVDIVDAKGVTTNWGCEGAGPGALSRRGWKKGDLNIGDTIVVDGYRAKDGSHLVDARRVTFPDGRTVYGGTPGDGGPGDNGTDQGTPAPAPAK